MDEERVGHTIVLVQDFSFETIHLGQLRTFVISSV